MAFEAVVLGAQVPAGITEENYIHQMLHWTTMTMEMFSLSSSNAHDRLPTTQSLDTEESTDRSLSLSVGQQTNHTTKDGTTIQQRSSARR